jgi:PAS domain S-box-containing protein
VFCLTASMTAFRLYARAREAEGRGRAPWIALTGVAAGSGIWATHFIAMLAYQPSIPVGYAASGTVLSLVLAVATTAAAFALAMPGGRARLVAGGVVFGLGVSAMHYCGMAAFQPQGWVQWDRATVVVSVLLGVALSIAAMLVCGDARDWRRRVGAGGLLTLAICSMHFTAMSAVTILPDPTLQSSAGDLGRGAMVVGIATLIGIVMAASGALLLTDILGRRSSMARMRLLFDANPAAMWLLDSRTLAFVSVNDAALREYGYTREQFLGMTAYDVVHPDEHDELRAFVAGERTTYEGERCWRHLRADGAEVIIQPYAQTLPYPGGKALLTALFDVTARERATDALKHAKEAAEAANQAKGDFLANMSHEIRTPLNGVLGVVDMLERTRMTAAQREMVGIIQSSASTLQRLLADVLDSSRIDAGELTIETRPFDLRALVDQTAHLHAPTARAKGVAFAVTFEGEDERWVTGDPERVRQVLGNLLSNAVKFTDAGEIALAVGFVGHDRVRFTVADTGVGFDAAFHDRLFNRFEQADASITRRFGGSGLGLAIARGVCQRMGGRLTAASTPGQGSTFVFELPLPRCEVVAAPAAAPRAEVAAGARPLRVLLADDHPVNRRVVELVLAAAEVELTSVENGLQAVEAFTAGPFDLVLMDLQMPVMDGLEAVGRIRDHEKRAGQGRAPIYVLSASALPEHIDASRAAGADAHLSKPIMAEALLAVVSSVSGQVSLAA